MDINIREVEGGYYIKLSGSGRRIRDWITKDKEEVVKIVKEKFLRELSPDNMQMLEKAMKEEEEREKK